MSIKNMHYQPQKLLKLKVFFSIILMVLLIVQLVSLVNIVQAISVDYRKITKADYDNLKSGELVQGVLDAEDVILTYQDQLASGSIVDCYAVLTEQKKVIVFSANSETAKETSKAFTGISNKTAQSVEFRGKVGTLIFTYRDSMMINLFMHNKYTEYKFDSKDVTWTNIALLDNDTHRWTVLLIATLMGTVALLAGLWFLLRKSINNIIYGLLVQKGVLEPELKVKKEDIELTNLDPYSIPENEGGNFYVNTELDTDSIKGDYKFTADYEKTPEQIDEERRAEKQEKESEEIRNILTSNRFIASSGLYGLVGHNLAKKDLKEEPVEFYQGGVNEEGFFYVDQNTEEKKEDIPGEQIRRY